jgi:hypothetical protein
MFGSAGWILRKTTHKACESHGGAQEANDARQPPNPLVLGLIMNGGTTQKSDAMHENGTRHVRCKRKISR